MYLTEKTYTAPVDKYATGKDLFAAVLRITAQHIEKNPNAEWAAGRSTDYRQRMADEGVIIYENKTLSERNGMSEVRSIILYRTEEDYIQHCRDIGFAEDEQVDSVDFASHGIMANTIKEHVKDRNSK